MLYTSQNKLIYNMEHAIKTKGFRESTDYAQSFRVACQGFYSKIKGFRNSTDFVFSSHMAKSSFVQHIKFFLKFYCTR